MVAYGEIRSGNVFINYISHYLMTLLVYCPLITELTVPKLIKTYVRRTAGRDIPDDVSEELREFNLSVTGRNLFDPSDAQLAGRKKVFSSVNFFNRQSTCVILQHGVDECFWIWLSENGYFQNGFARFTVLMSAFVLFAHNRSELQPIFTEALLFELWDVPIFKKTADKLEKFCFQRNRKTDQSPAVQCLLN
jgi:hypothetical protein